jgi:hypothetical protein
MQQLMQQQQQLLQQNTAAEVEQAQQLLQQMLQQMQQWQQLTQQMQPLQQQVEQLHLQAGPVVPAARVHTAAAALAPALRHLPNLRACHFSGQPVPEGILPLLPSSLQSLQISQRAFRGPVNLAAASRLVALDLPDLQPGDTLPPTLRMLVLRGQQRAVLNLRPLQPLTQLETLEMLGCTAQDKAAEWLVRIMCGIPALRVDVRSSSELFPSVLWRPDLAVDHFASHRCGHLAGVEVGGMLTLSICVHLSI